MKHKEYRLSTEAVIHSLHDALMVPRDYTAAVTRLTNTINRLPKGRLQIVHSHKGVSFYLKDKYLRKQTELVYSLARKRYCETLLQVITSDKNREKAFETLEELIRDFTQGNLNLARILLTPQQYKWFYGRYEKKPFPREQTAEVLTIPQGDTVRSKSEQQIGIELHNYAVPCHYEEDLYLNVQKLVRSLKSELQERNQFPKTLYTYRGYTCVWNVPAEYSWMNAPGSIWRSYDDRTGCVQIYPDYTIMLADGSLLYWEHEGMLYQFRYRNNALERVEIIRLSGQIPRTRIIKTDEPEANDKEALREIIRSGILPYLWF